MMHYTGDADGKRIGEILEEDYTEAHQALNGGAGSWFWRCMFSVPILGIEGALRKHRAEWRQALGLPGVTMAIPPLPRLQVNGSRFQTAAGLPWQWRGSTDFSLYLQFLQGADLGPVLLQRRLAGATILRVLGMVNSFAHLWPQEQPQFYASLPAFARRLAEADLYLEFVVFADAQVIMPDVSAQQRHFAAVCASLQDSPNALLELGNEYGDWRSGDYGKNGFNPANFSKPAGLLSCRGSAVGDVPPIPSPWAYSTFHETRSYPGWVKDGNTIEIQNGYGDYPGLGYSHPIVHDEPMKMGTGFTTDRSLIAQFAGIVGASCAGGTYHSQQGIFSQVWDDETRDCAEVFYRSLSGCAE